MISRILAAKYPLLQNAMKPDAAFRIFPKNVNKPAVTGRHRKLESSCFHFTGCASVLCDSRQRKGEQATQTIRTSAFRSGRESFRGRAVISSLNAFILLHLYTQHYISTFAKCQFFFRSRERFPRFYLNGGFLADCLMKYHEK